MRQEYYTGSRTRITDPFYACTCPAGHLFWSITPMEKCHECARQLESCVPADRKKAASRS